MKCKSFEQILLLCFSAARILFAFLSFVAPCIRATRSSPFQFESGS